MGQEEVLEVLEKNRAWILVGEIMGILNESRVVINNALRKLLKSKEAETRSFPRMRGGLRHEWRFKQK